MNPETIHGFPILARHTIPKTRDGKQGQYILVDRGKDSHHRYVTALHFDGDHEWLHGHYFDDLIEAEDDLVERVLDTLGSRRRPA